MHQERMNQHALLGQVRNWSRWPLVPSFAQILCPPWDIHDVFTHSPKVWQSYILASITSIITFSRFLQTTLVQSIPTLQAFLKDKKETVQGAKQSCADDSTLKITGHHYLPLSSCITWRLRQLGLIYQFLRTKRAVNRCCVVLFGGGGDGESYSSLYKAGSSELHQQLQANSGYKTSIPSVLTAT